MTDRPRARLFKTLDWVVGVVFALMIFYWFALALWWPDDLKLIVDIYLGRFHG